MGKNVTVTMTKLNGYEVEVKKTDNLTIGSHMGCEYLFNFAAKKVDCVEKSFVVGNDPVVTKDCRQTFNEFSKTKEGKQQLKTVKRFLKEQRALGK